MKRSSLMMVVIVRVMNTTTEARRKVEVVENLPEDPPDQEEIDWMMTSWLMVQTVRIMLQRRKSLNGHQILRNLRVTLTMARRKRREEVVVARRRKVPGQRSFRWEMEDLELRRGVNGQMNQTLVTDPRRRRGMLCPRLM